MKVKVNYLGLIVDHTKLKEENFELKEAVFEELQNLLTQKYPFLNEISYKIAVNQAFGQKGLLLKKEDEIAVLPPFAGG